MGALDSIATAYPRAEVTTVVVHDRLCGVHLIVYAVAELCPPDQPTSPCVGTAPYFMLRERIDGDTSTLYVRRDLVDVSAALAFFRGTDGTRSIGTSPPLETAGPLIEVTSDEEPILVPSNLSEASSAGAMLPQRPTALGLLSKYDTGGATKRALGDSALSRVGEVVRAALGVDLARFPEHVGAIHLCFANPILRRFERTLGADGRTLLVRCYERAGSSIAGCGVEFLNEWQPLGTGFCIRQQIATPFFTVDLPAPPHSLRVRLFDTAGRCIEDESAVFIKNISLDMAIASPRRVVLVGADGKQEVRDVQAVARERGRSSRQAVPPAPIVVLAEAQRHRQLDELAAQRVFLYFPGGEASKREAREVVRELLGQARERCDIVDPYLGPEEVGMFVPFVATNGCKVRMLSSHMFLRQGEGRSHEDRLVQRLEELKALPLVLEARKIEGPRRRDRRRSHDLRAERDGTCRLAGVGRVPGSGTGRVPQSASSRPDADARRRRRMARPLEPNRNRGPRPRLS